MSQFNQTTAGSPVQTCPLCQAAWDKVDSEVRKIDSMGDVRERNRAISASYARLYTADPDLKWAGAAAFASKQVGCGMDEFGASVSGAKSALGKGNLAVYDELYPALRFYQQNKGSMSNDQIMKCMDGTPVPLNPAIKDGLQQTMNGDPYAGAMTMLKHEQQDTLQNAVYDSFWFRTLLVSDSITGYWFAPVKYSISSECSAADTSKAVDFKSYSGNLSNFDDRWPFASDCANKFIRLSEGKDSEVYVRQELEKISDASPP